MLEVVLIDQEQAEVPPAEELQIFEATVFRHLDRTTQARLGGICLLGRRQGTADVLVHARLSTHVAELLGNLEVTPEALECVVDPTRAEVQSTQIAQGDRHAHAVAKEGLVRQGERVPVHGLIEPSTRGEHHAHAVVDLRTAAAVLGIAVQPCGFEECVQGRRRVA